MTGQVASQFSSRIVSPRPGTKGTEIASFSGSVMLNKNNQRFNLKTGYATHRNIDSAILSPFHKNRNQDKVLDKIIEPKMSNSIILRSTNGS
jgi:hypothetical protein